ncbi:protein trichome birefringence-like 34 [Heracleum sosnowskyi]|uniref:Protein trichome birefringence-like 34 n=1 Tax=Heracleum sosnowskyi TaxID=360622 RepID=A0AAD8GW09_9APIA|nr:protein trichome birefringence-like 34 [Heracleum sosnowskyi]
MAEVYHTVLSAAGSIWRSLQSSAAFFITIFVIGVIYFPRENGRLYYQKEEPLTNNSTSKLSTDQNHTSQNCDLFSGKWVYDNKSYPLYKEEECTFMLDENACQKFGRKDLNYRHWRWQPHQCELPRFNATVLLESLRNKRMVFVGDSLNRGQWISMACLVEKVIPPSLRSRHYSFNHSLVTLKAQQYNASIEFYWSPMLVESNSDDPWYHRFPDPIVREQAIYKHARHWNDADILIFDTYHWWRRPFINTLWGTFGSTDGIFKRVEMLRSYEMALKTWSDWLEIHIDRNKSQLFFMSMSPVHKWGEEWGKSTNDNCYNEEEMIEKEGYRGNETDPRMMRIVEDAIDDLEKRGLKVKLINITQLSEYRKDGHPSIYRKQWVVLSEEQLANPTSYSDCTHWCLPGVPDVWNELLYAHIFT